MALFKKKTTLVHHITYMGIMAAINLIFILLATFFPPLMFVFILLLPFASAVVSYYCLKRFYIIYAVATVGLCLLCSAFNFGDTIFYIIPAIASGFVIGVLLEQKVHPFWLVLSTAIINAALTYAFIPLVNLITNTDIVFSILKIFNLQDYTYRTELVYLFVFLISLAKCALSNFIILGDAKKIGIQINTRINSFWPYIIGLETSIALAIGCSLFYLPLGLVFICISFYFAAFLLVDLIFSRKLLIYIVSGVIVLAMIFVFAIFYKSLKEPYGIVLTIIFPLAIGAVSFLKNCLLKYPVNI